MASVNKVILLGNCGRDPEVRYMPNGDAALNMSIATSRVWKDKAGERQEETEWHNLSFFGRVAEIAGEYLHKGDPVFVEGRLRTRKWEKDGVDRYTTEIVVDHLQLLGGKRDRDEGGRAPAPAPSKAPAQPRAQAPRQQDGFDDDIPF